MVKLLRAGKLGVLRHKMGQAVPLSQAPRACTRACGCYTETMLAALFIFVMCGGLYGLAALCPPLKYDHRPGCYCKTKSGPCVS